MPEPAWKHYGYSSYEEFIGSKAGACPPDVWPGQGILVGVWPDDRFPFDPDVPVWPPEDEALEVPDE